MKILKYYIVLIVSAMLLNGCVDDSASNPEFGDKDQPHIYMNWQANMAYKLGQTIAFAPLVSPSDGATYEWTLNGEVISTEKDLTYQLNEFLSDAEFKFEVTRNGVSNHRVASLLVTKVFEPKESTKKCFGFLTKNGTVGDVNWESITHLIVSSAVVNADGSLDMSLEQVMDLELLTTFAHHYGVYVLLEVSGIIEYLNSKPLYDSRTFYNAALSNPELVISNIQNVVAAYGFDGVNIYMDKPIAESYDDPAGVKTFFELTGDAFKSKLNTIDGKEYPYITSLSVCAGWTRASLAGVVNLEQYDYVHVLAFLLEELSPFPHSSVSQATTEVNAWLTWAGMQITDPSRIILVAPAFGLRYFGIPNDYTWANLELYTQYISYRTLCSQYSGVPDTNLIVNIENNNVATREVDKIYYNGFRDIERKVDLVAEKGLGGIGLWSLENDSRNASESLIIKMKEYLDNVE